MEGMKANSAVPFSQYKSSVDYGRLPQSMNCSLDVSHITGHIAGEQARPAHCTTLSPLNEAQLIENPVGLPRVWSLLLFEESHPKSLLYG